MSRCQARTQKGTECKKPALPGQPYCAQHTKMAAEGKALGVKPVRARGVRTPRASKYGAWKEVRAPEVKAAAAAAGIPTQGVKAQELRLMLAQAGAVPPAGAPMLSPRKQYARSPAKPGSRTAFLRMNKAQLQQYAVLHGRRDLANASAKDIKLQLAPPASPRGRRAAGGGRAVSGLRKPELVALATSRGIPNAGKMNVTELRRLLANFGATPLVPVRVASSPSLVRLAPGSPVRLAPVVYRAGSF